MDPKVRLSSDNAPVMNLVIYQNVAKLTGSAVGRGVTSTTLGSSLFCLRSLIHKPEFDVDIKSAKLMTKLK